MWDVKWETNVKNGGPKLTSISTDGHVKQWFLCFKKKKTKGGVWPPSCERDPVACMGCNFWTNMSYYNDV